MTFSIPIACVITLPHTDCVARLPKGHNYSQCYFSFTVFFGIPFLFETQGCSCKLNVVAYMGLILINSHFPPYVPADSTATTAPFSCNFLFLIVCLWGHVIQVARYFGNFGKGVWGKGCQSVLIFGSCLPLFSFPQTHTCMHKHTHSCFPTLQCGKWLSSKQHYHPHMAWSR